MAVELVMPRLSESMEQGTVVSWLVPDGTPVRQGDEIAEIETDKATLPYEAPETGILRILVPEGSTLALGEPIGLIDDLAPLPGNQSVAPPGTEPASVGGGRVPPPRSPDLEPSTASYELQPELHEPPHTVHASTPPPGRRDTAWSPAWGPQPAASRTGEPAAHAEDETTEFAAIDPATLPPRPPVARPAAPAQQPAPVEARSAAAPLEPPAPTPEPAPALPIPPAPDDRANVLADDGSHGYGPLFGDAPPARTPASAPVGDVTPDQAATDAADAQVEDQVAAMPWVDTSLGTKPPSDDRRFTPDELIAPQTLPPRPPELQPTAAAARVKASPVARRLARELGIDLSTLEGTGPEGRVVRADIEAAQALGAARPPKQTAAAPTAASEFTPPVDDARAAAPIPAVEPTPEPDPDPAAEALVEAAAAAADAITAAEEAVVAAPRSPEGELEVVAEPQDADVAPEAPAADADADPDPDPEFAYQDAATEAQPDATEPDAAIAPPEVAEVDDAAVDTQPEVAATDDEPGEQPDAEADTPETLTVESEIQAEPEETPVDAPEPIETAADASAPEPAPETAPETPAAEPAAPVSESRVLPAAQPGRGKGEPTVTELTRQAQTVARRMSESKATIPDFHTVVEVDAAPLLALRAELTATRPDLPAPSVNDLLVKATAVALRAFPALNGAYRDGRLEQYPRVNVGIAVDADGKLLVPVVHDADQLSVSQIAARTDEVVGKARDGSLRPPDIASATFTVSNLGSLGVERFTAVITPGQAGILTAGAIAERPVVRGGEVVAGQTFFLTLTTDHRAIYGAQAAAFLARVRQLLERPSSLLA